MFSYVFSHQLSKSQAAAKGLICLFALIFFLFAALSSLPSFGVLSEQFEANGLAGYTETDNNQADKHESALKQFTDRPLNGKTSSESSEKSENSRSSDSRQTPVRAQKVAL